MFTDRQMLSGWVVGLFFHPRKEEVRNVCCSNDLFVLCGAELQRCGPSHWALGLEWLQTTAPLLLPPSE